MSKIGTSLVVGIAVVATIFATISVLSLTGKINFANEGAKILHGEVVYAYGDVYKEKGGELVKIGDGEIINEGDVIKTNADSKATVLFDDGSIVRLSDNTQIEIKDIFYLEQFWLLSIKFNTSDILSKVISSNQSNIKINFWSHLILNLFIFSSKYPSKLFSHKFLKAIKKGKNSLFL